MQVLSRWRMCRCLCRHLEKGPLALLPWRTLTQGMAGPICPTGSGKTPPLLACELDSEESHRQGRCLHPGAPSPETPARILELPADPQGQLWPELSCVSPPGDGLLPGPLTLAVHPRRCAAGAASRNCSCPLHPGVDAPPRGWQGRKHSTPTRSPSSRGPRAEQLEREAVGAGAKVSARPRCEASLTHQPGPPRPRQLRHASTRQASGEDLQPLQTQQRKTVGLKRASWTAAEGRQQTPTHGRRLGAENGASCASGLSLPPRWSDHGPWRPPRPGGRHRPPDGSAQRQWPTRPSRFLGAA